MEPKRKKGFGSGSKVFFDKKKKKKKIKVDIKFFIYK